MALRFERNPGAMPLARIAVAMAFWCAVQACCGSNPKAFWNRLALRCFFETGPGLFLRLCFFIFPPLESPRLPRGVCLLKDNSVRYFSFTPANDHQNGNGSGLKPRVQFRLRSEFGNAFFTFGVLVVNEDRCGMGASSNPFRGSDLRRLRFWFCCVHGCSPFCPCGAFTISKLFACGFSNTSGASKK